MSTEELEYLTPEAGARVEIDAMLKDAGWAVQHARQVNLAASRGVAVREFVMKKPHGRADYLLFLDGRAVGVVEATRLGATQRSPKNHTGVRMRPYLRAANVTWEGLDLSDVKE